MKFDNFDGNSYTKELLPCPFCGENKEAPPYLRKELKHHFDEPHYIVECSNCGCINDMCFESVSAAITGWNTRKLHNHDLNFMNGFHVAKEHIMKLIDQLHLKKNE